MFGRGVSALKAEAINRASAPKNGVVFSENLFTVGPIIGWES